MSRATPTKRTKITPIQLSPEASRAFDELLAAQAAARELRDAEQRLRDARSLLEQAFGPAFLAQTSDGRLIQRCQQSRHYGPLEAREVTWQEFQEICPWD